MRHRNIAIIKSYIQRSSRRNMPRPGTRTLFGLISVQKKHLSWPELRLSTSWSARSSVKSARPDFQRPSQLLQNSSKLSKPCEQHNALKCVMADKASFATTGNSRIPRSISGLLQGAVGSCSKDRLPPLFVSSAHGVKMSFSEDEHGHALKVDAMYTSLCTSGCSGRANICGSASHDGVP
jgi:hypothetical protein